MDFTDTALTASMLERDIVTDLFDFSKKNSNLHTLSTERVDISTFIKSSIDCHIPKALEKKIELHNNITSEQVYCNVNRAKLSRCWIT